MFVRVRVCVRNFNPVCLCVWVRMRMRVRKLASMRVCVRACMHNVSTHFRACTLICARGVIDACKGV
jgi:hypothetical protein